MAMTLESFIRALGAVVLGVGIGLVSYLFLDLLAGSGQLATVGAVLIGIISTLTIGWAFQG
jgi:hypothetical protein